MDKELHLPDENEVIIKNPMCYGSYKSSYYIKRELEIEPGQNFNFDLLLGLRLKVMLPAIKTKPGYSLRWSPEFFFDYILEARIYRGGNLIQAVSGDFIRFYQSALASKEQNVLYTFLSETNLNFVSEIESQEISLDIPFTFSRDPGLSLISYSGEDKFRVELELEKDLCKLFEIEEVKYNSDNVKVRTRRVDTLIEYLENFDNIHYKLLAEVVTNLNSVDKQALLVERRGKSIVDKYKFVSTDDYREGLKIEENCHTLVFYTKKPVDVTITFEDGVEQNLSPKDMREYIGLKTFKRLPDKNYYVWTNAINYREVLSIKPKVGIKKIDFSKRTFFKVMILSTELKQI